MSACQAPRRGRTPVAAAPGTTADRRRDSLVLFEAKIASGDGLTAAEQAHQASPRASVDHFIPVIGALREMGLVDRMGFGSDAGPFDTELGHMEYSDEIARLAGLSPMESLQVVTGNAAWLCGLDGTVGKVEAGKAADLLVLDGNPLDDVGNLTRVAAVLMGGERVA